MREVTDPEVLLKQYVEEYHPTDVEGILNVTTRYLSTMEDSQVKVLLYQLSKLVECGCVCER